jgi:hypothetical protein
MFFFIFITVFTFTAQAGVGKADSILKQRIGYSQKLKKLVKELVDDELYYSAIPWAKEYLARGTNKYDTSFEKSLSKIIQNTHMSHFETLPLGFLKKSNLNTIKYIIGKKLLKKSSYRAAKQYLKSINANHSIYPYAMNALGTVYALEQKWDASIEAFNTCKNTSNQNKYDGKINAHYCILGIARTQFANKDYKKAELSFLDIPKSSPVWPHILFEEAWNSYYMKNYNRTLGKLVTYNAPMFNRFFNPEYEVLKALSYLKLCLYKDAKKVSDKFYSKYMTPTRKLRVFLKRKGKDYNYFYKLYNSLSKNKTSGNRLLDSLISSFQTDAVIRSLSKSQQDLYKEYERVKNMKSLRIKKSLLSNLRDVIGSGRKYLGAFVRSKLIEKYAQLYRGFEGMSYIKLEVLAQRKAKLYNFDDTKKKRGDIKYLERNEKQYFWNFNGEFWADELGDYVFALKSEC